jgi:beta-lactamase class D
MLTVSEMMMMVQMMSSINSFKSMGIQPFYGKEAHIIVGWFVGHVWKNDNNWYF